MFEAGLKTIDLYTDGACSGNPGKGGYGVVLKYKDHVKELSGGYLLTTNNRMEILAVIRGLEALHETCNVNVYSDSKYVIDAITQGWVYKWEANGWMRGKNTPAKNAELWQRIDELCAFHTVTFHWVKGHADNPYNNRCDQLAVQQRDLHA